MRQTSNFSLFITLLPNSKCLLAIFTLKITSQKGQREAVVSRLQNELWLNEYPIALYRGTKPPKSDPAERTGGKSVLTFLFLLSNHTNGKSTHFQSDLLLLHAPILFWQPLSSKTNRHSALKLFLTFHSPIFTSSQL